jgi:hypothetical protein
MNVPVPTRYVFRLLGGFFLSQLLSRVEPPDIPCANISLSHSFEQSYIVLELMHASLESLGKRLRRSTAAPSEILLVALQAGGALTAALERIHEHGCLRKCIRHQCCITLCGSSWRACKLRNWFVCLRCECH